MSWGCQGWRGREEIWGLSGLPPHWQLGLAWPGEASAPPTVPLVAGDRVGPGVASAGLSQILRSGWGENWA